MKAALPIIFKPTYEVDDYVWLLFHNKISQFRIVSRHFTDNGDDEMDYVYFEKLSKKVINADERRQFNIRYVLYVHAGNGRVSSGETLPIPESLLFKTKEDLINSLK